MKRDKRADEEGAVIAINQGEFAISDRAGDVLSTLLGSCVAACLFDPLRRIGGMNHFLLPGADPRDCRNIKYGAYSMERLINALLRAGAQRERLEGKLFGGARMIRSLSDIGQGNADFARRFLADEGIRLVSHCLGGTRGLRVRYWPASGRAQALRVGPPVDLAVSHANPLPRLPPGLTESGDVDLF